MSRRTDDVQVSAKYGVVTGATSGIGKMAARALGDLNFSLVLIGRNERAGRRLVDKLRQRHPASRFEFLRTDLSRPNEVRALGRAIDFLPRIDVLINNAGLRNDEYRESADGIELTFAINHLGHFLLTSLLIKQLLRSTAARIITVSSGSHFAANASGNWYLHRHNYDRRLAYAKSKLANVMFAYQLAHQLRGTPVTSNVYEPGGVASNFARNNGLIPWCRHMVGHALARDLTSSRKAAESLVYVASANELASVTGVYFRRSRVVESSAASRDRSECGRLWELSLQLTNAIWPF